MSSDFTLTAAAPLDLGEVLALLTTVGLPHEGVPELLTGRVGDFILARDPGGRLVGCAALERYGRLGLLRSVAVSPDLRRPGLGSRLVSAVLEAARGAGVEEVVLLTTTAGDFFAGRFGFVNTTRDRYEQELAASPEWLLPRCSSAAVMRLDLRRGKHPE